LTANTAQRVAAGGEGRAVRVAYADQIGAKLSRELQLGKAAEHLVCADLILQGYSAFLADQGLPYDVVVDTGSGFKTVQVKSSSAARDRPSSRVVTAYWFNMRRAKGGSRAMRRDEVDVIAFVALDTRRVAYFRSSSLIGKAGSHLVQALWLRGDKSNAKDLGFRWHRGDDRLMRCMMDYAHFPHEAPQ
jgi:hypothetical protein